MRYCFYSFFTPSAFWVALFTCYFRLQPVCWQSLFLRCKNKTFISFWHISFVYLLRWLRTRHLTSLKFFVYLFILFLNCFPISFTYSYFSFSNNTLHAANTSISGVSLIYFKIFSSSILTHSTTLTNSLPPSLLLRYSRSTLPLWNSCEKFRSLLILSLSLYPSSSTHLSSNQLFLQSIGQGSLPNHLMQGKDFYIVALIEWFWNSFNSPKIFLIRSFISFCLITNFWITP